MLTLTGPATHRFCDGLPRRDFRRIGAFGGALTLADMLRLQAQEAKTPARTSRNKGVTRHRLGIDPSQSFLSKSGRKMFILEDREPIPELIE